MRSADSFRTYGETRVCLKCGKRRRTFVLPKGWTKHREIYLCSEHREEINEPVTSPSRLND